MISKFKKAKKKKDSLKKYSTLPCLLSRLWFKLMLWNQLSNSWSTVITINIHILVLLTITYLRILNSLTNYHLGLAIEFCLSKMLLDLTKYVVGVFMDMEKELLRSVVQPLCMLLIGRIPRFVRSDFYKIDNCSS